MLNFAGCVVRLTSVLPILLDEVEWCSVNSTDVVVPTQLSMLCGTG